MKIHTDDQMLRLAPDEPPAGGVDGEPTNDSPPTAIEVDGEKVPLSDLQEAHRRRRDFERANHERATELKRDREAFQAEQRAAQQERQAAGQERQAFLQTLQGFQPAKEPDAAEKPISVHALLQENKLDLVGDEEAPAKLATILDTAMQTEYERRDRLAEQRLQRREAALRQEFTQQLQGTTRSIEQSRARERATSDAETANRELFERRLRSEHADILKQLDDDGREAVFARMRGLIDAEYGALDPTAQWRWNEKAVDQALWLAEPSRRLLLARETAEARSDGLHARVRGEEASRSTPTRAQRRTAANGDDALVDKRQRVAQAYARGEMSADQAIKAFTAEERKRLNVLQGRG